MALPGILWRLLADSWLRRDVPSLTLSPSCSPRHLLLRVTGNFVSAGSGFGGWCLRSRSHWLLDWRRDAWNAEGEFTAKLHYHFKFYFVLLNCWFFYRSGTDCAVLVGVTLFTVHRSLRFRCFISDQDGIWQDYFPSEYTSVAKCSHNWSQF